jgi:hypothetical protein
MLSRSYSKYVNETNNEKIKKYFWGLIKITDMILVVIE